MRIKRIVISNLRNHSSTIFEAGEGLNYFYGQNGSGKTTILEAISISSFSKSFLPSSDSILVRNGENTYSVSCNAVNDLGIPYSVSVKYNGSRKSISSTIGENLSPKDIIGEIPVVILSPDYKSITFGSPQDRREFLDRILCQSSKIYCEELIKLKKIVRQRNNLLNDFKSRNKFDKKLLSSWTELFIQTSSGIISRRYSFINDFLSYFIKFYKLIANGKEKVNLHYQSNIPVDNFDQADIIRKLIIKSKQIEDEEIRRGVTLFGPQKDEIRIGLNTGIAKDIASQGQHKSLLISLKFAEFQYLLDKKNETPVILLDDIFSELDSERSQKVLELVESSSAQTFITLTDINSLNNILPDNKPGNRYFINNGSVIPNGV